MKFAHTVVVTMVACLAAIAVAQDNIKIGDYTYVFPYPSDSTAQDWEYVSEGSWAVDPETSEPVSVQIQNPPFISKYIEGSSYNKVIELYNPTEEAVDLTPFSLRTVWSGGESGNSGTTVPLSGTIEARSAFVVAHSRADIPAETADLLVSFPFNGNDAVQLFKGDDLIDTVGDLKGNPGDGWTVAGVVDATKDHTLVRKSSVLGGTRVWSSSAGTDVDDSQWIVRDVNDFTGLGEHTIDIPTTTPLGPPVVRLTGEASMMRLEAKFDLPSAGVYDVWARVQIASDAILDDLVLTLFGTSSTGIDIFYSKEMQDETAPRDEWYEFQVGKVNATTSSLAHYVLSHRTMFANDTLFSGYMVDYLRIEKIADLNPPVLTIMSPFASEDIPSSTVPVTFSVANYDLEANGYVFYELDGSPPPLEDVQLKTTSFTVYSVAPGNHVLKLFLFDIGANRVVAQATRSFSVRLPPPSISRILLTEQEFTSIGIRWESPVANAISSYEAKYRRQNDDGSFGEWAELYSGSGTDALAGDLLPAVTYHFAVRGINSVGASAWAAAAFRTRGVVRVNAEHASPRRRAQLVEAIRGLNAKGLWQQMAHLHMRAFGITTDQRSNVAHRGPFFLVWHFQFLKVIETMLQQEVNDPTMGLMYWCWHCFDTPGAARQESNIFTPEFMGGNGDVDAPGVDWRGGLVRDGPFRHCDDGEEGCNPFIIIQDYEWDIIPATTGLRRAFDDSINARFPTRAQVEEALSTFDYWDNYPGRGGIRPTIESWHNSAHVFIGGSMLSGTSPNDPVFYLNHVNTDYLYYMWRERYPDAPFETPGASYPPGQGFNDPMWPWDGEETEDVVTPADVYNPHEAGVRYAEEWSPDWETVAEVGTKEEVTLANNDFSDALSSWTFENVTEATSPDAGVYVDGYVFQASTVKIQAYRVYTLVVFMEASEAAYEVALTAGGDFENIEILSKFDGQQASRMQVDFTTASSHVHLGESMGVLVRSLDDGQVHLVNVSIVSEVISEAMLQEGLSGSAAIGAPVNVEVVVVQPKPSVTPGDDDDDDDSLTDGPDGNGDDDDDSSSSSGGSSGLTIGLVSAAVAGTFGGAIGGYFLGMKRRGVPRPDDYHAQL